MTLGLLFIYNILYKNLLIANIILGGHMKKFALGILSVFMILGGVLLSACEKKVSLSVSTEEVVIYTNDEQAENYQSKVIDVSLENSSSGINVEILKGGDSIRLSPVTVKNSSNYSFTIYADKSGEAEVKVSAKEDSKQSKIVSVHVMTVLEEIKTLSEDSVDGRTNLFVTKGVEKKLNVDDYFSLEPVTANVCDIIWSFEDSEEENSQQFVKDGILYATIQGDVLYVNEDFDMSYINLRASFANNTNVYNTVRFEVLEKSTINNLTIDGVALYQNNSVATNEATFKLTRNNSNLSSVEGSIVINTPYEISLSPVVYEKLDNGDLQTLSKSEYENYLTLEIDAPVVDEATNKITYNFTIDALDKSSINKFGTFYFYFKIGYKDYNFDLVSDGSTAVLDTFYSATRIEVSNANGDILNNNVIDVFSNYETGNGYQISTTVLPTEVAIDNSMYYISVDLNQDALKNLALDENNPVSSVIKVYYRGQELTFTHEAGSSVYTSPIILNNSDIYVASGSEFDILEGVEFRFVSVSNADASTSLTMNFYRISEDENLTITDANDEDIPSTTYISSSVNASKSMTFNVKIKDLSTISGLTLKSDENSRFIFSDIQYVSSSLDPDEGVYVIVRFTVSLNGYNFDSSTNFWFEHVTGKTSAKFGIHAFVPLSLASISNADKASSDVYKDEQTVQNFVELAGLIDSDATRQSSSLSKLMLEAGTSIPLNTNYQNASLSETAISYKMLSFDTLVAAVKVAEGIIDDNEALARAEELFSSNDLNTIALNYYRYFEDNNGLYFTINESRLSLTDNAFKGYVCVLFSGYDEEHNEIVLARFFALESFYSVRYLSSDVKTALLYTTETLSQSDIGLSRVDVTVSMRPDEKVPTYSNDLSYFNFTSALDDFEGTQDGNYLKNRYYEISNISFASSGRYLKFRITANSTNMQTSVRDILTISYMDENGFERKTEIQIEIRNVKRIESVQWLNQTEDNEIYLNLTTTVSSERSFTISTSVSPSDANDTSLAYAYFASYGSSSDLSITTSSIGQTFNLNINTSKGGYGNLYLLPNDMIKTVDGVDQVLVYKYTEDEAGEIVETAKTIRLSEFDSYYDKLINENDEFSTYFYNNDGVKIYYKDLIVKIAITIADGMSEGTAIRVYNEADLKNIDTAKYYRIMNNITLTNWESYNEFSGMFFGKDDTITLTFEGNSQSFVNTLLEKGVIKNLIFAGNVTSAGTESAGFVANTNYGIIDGVSVDVYYADGEYKSSTLNATASYVGGIAGYNFGTIKNTYSYGVTINATNGMYVGGIAGNNQKTIENCGVEFYNFVTQNGNSSVTASNKITTTGAVGGIVGFGGATSIIEKSYAYAYSLMEAGSCAINNVFANSTATKGAFLAAFEAGAVVNESFAFMGSLRAPVESNTSAQMITFKNSYITYYNGTTSTAAINTRIFVNATFAYTNQIYYGDTEQIGDSNVLQITDIPSDYNNPTQGEKWSNLVARLSSDIWETVDVDDEINFGFMYLKNTTQSAAVDVANVNIANNVSPLKSLSAGNDKGILFVYSPTVTISDSAEQSALTSYNTISVADLFGVTAEQAKSLLITSESKNISINSNSIRVLSKSVTEIELNVHSKMNFTSYKTFKFVILNYLPELSTTIDSVELKDSQTVLLQTGLNNSRTIMFNMNNTIYLNGTGYSTAKDTFTVDYNLTGNTYTDDSGEEAVTKDYVTVSKSNNSLTLLGNKNHENGDVTEVEAYIVVDDVANDSDYSNAIKTNRNRNFDVSVYNGATSLVINNATNLIVKPSQYAVFDVSLETDAENDNLVFGLQYGEIEISNEISSDEYAAKFVVDSKLTLNVSWTRTPTETGFSFRVWVRIDDANKHLIDQIYDDLTLKVNAESQSSNTNYLKTVGLTVMTQEIEDISISTYNIESRQIRNSVLYLIPADEITNTLTPSSDAIIAVTVDPAYAMMTKFRLTYSVSGGSGTTGTVNISKLAYNSRYGYYINSNSTSLIENGIEVTLTDEDRTGNGVFYFRVYVSSAFETSSSLQFTLTYYNGNTPLISGTHNLNIDYLQSANIKVNGASTYVLAKGGSATVTVTVDKNQELEDLYLQNNGANISLSAAVVEEFDTYKVYTATISAYVDAKLTENKDSGIFYVCATVKRVVNNNTEIKESRATICLVDFSVDGNNIKVSSSGGTSTYNGQTYDVFYSYINATDTLSFDYPFDPETYNYDQNDASEVAAVEAIMEKRARFELNNTYKDEEVGYYINYDLNEQTGVYEEISLKYQLWYATDENNSTAICNGSGIVQNGIFRIDEAEGRYEDGTPYSYLTVTGLRTGRQLMKLRTTITYQGIEMYYDYYFLIVVEVWSDEDTPTQIFTADEFIDYATNSEQADDYILMNDIVLTDYTPLDTDLIDSLDGNGYTIHINSFAYPEGSSLNLALFNTVTENTTLKNVRVNIYNGGQITVNISQYTDINIAGFAIENNGIIYNSEVLAYYDEEYQSSSISGETGLVVRYTMGTNTDPIEITSGIVSSLGIESLVSGFVITNNASITNSRVGGDSFRQIIDIAGANYLKTQDLNLFVLRGQGEVSGFVNDNASSGYISASFADNIQIYNDMASTTSLTAGFAVYNHNNIQGSYVEGKGEELSDDGKIVIYNNLSNITSIGIVGGFVYQNDALIKNSYSNIAIENSESKASLVAGFVYINSESAEVTLCYAACDITKSDISQMQFSGVDDYANSLNYGTISFSYFYNESLIDDTNQNNVTSGALSVSDVMNEDTFYGFSFASEPGAYNGIWSVSNSEKLTLVSANQISFSNRYAVTNGSVTSIFYNRSIIDADTMRSVDLSYGSDNNPIIIRSAYDFAMATGKAGATEISSYKEYYSDTEVFGNYRIVNNIDMSEIDQNSENDNSIKLQTTKKTFTGLFDGNGFTISNISLGSSEVAENFGLFAKLDGAVIMNLDLIVDSIHNSRANIVGTLAGTAVDSRIISISLSPVTTQTTSKTSILGNNVVGGVVGMLFGESKMSDINVVDIDVYSAFYLSGKGVNSNEGNVGSTLRGYASNGNSISTYVSRISYAGAIAGYVDIYDSLNAETVLFSSSLEVSDYDIVTVHVSDSVNIYGEVAGGLFGYVGNSTMVYDATLELDADMNLSKPSYIISKNLFAGGLIGENYGGLFAVSASYASELQNTIEEAENGYYSGNTAAERGQQSIFSYTPSDEGYASNINNPLYIGGLVGYMGGGYIYIGYSKLNVISHSDFTLAVGGIIGLAGYKDTQYDLTFLDPVQKVNVYLNDVYASGDVYIDSTTGNGYSAGIIGALERTSDGHISVVALKNVLAVNYYSYNGSKLVGDRTASTEDEGGYVSDRHFMLVGKVVSSVNNNIDNDDVVFGTSLYLIDSENYYLDISKGYEYGTHQSNTVGGYTNVELGSNSVTLSLKPYGFTTSWDDGTSEKLYNALVDVESIGDQSMTTMSNAYAKMYSYFLANGWSEEYWEHTEENLFPHIQLLPVLNVIFWDQYNTDEVLQAMENSSVTVILRGKVDKDTNEYKDIDLRNGYKDSNEVNHVFEAISGFHGTLISYYDYANSNTEGMVTEEVTESDGTVVGGYAGSGTNAADKVGIIINKPFFDGLTDNATVEGINFYLCENEDSAIKYTLIDGGAGDTILRDVKITANNNIEISTETMTIGSDTAYSGGLIARDAHGTSFINITINLRNDAEIEFTHGGSSDKDYEIYMGLLAGYIEQTSAFNQINIQGIQIAHEGAEDDEEPAKSNIDFSVDDSSESSVSVSLYAGLYAGKITKGTGRARISLGLSNVGNVNLNFDIDADGTKKAYIGGFAGEIEAVDAVELINSDENSGSINALDINQQSNVDSLYAGVAFGNIVNSYLTISNTGTSAVALSGGVYQVGDVTSKQTYIGGIAGSVNSSTSIQSFSIDFSVGKKNDLASVANDYVVDEDTGETLFDQNLYSYNNQETDVAGLTPFIIETENNADVIDIGNIGGFFGYVSGATITVTGSCNVSGNIDVQIGKEATTKNLTEADKEVYLGGVIGQTTGALIVNSSMVNDINISVKEPDLASVNAHAHAYIGGLVGKMTNVDGENGGNGNPASSSVNTSQIYLQYNGTVLASVKDLTFGGAIGYIEREDYTNQDKAITISGVIYGGAVKIYGQEKDDKTYNLPENVTVGGIVGEYNNTTSLENDTLNSVRYYTISNCYTYGDVFVNYLSNGIKNTQGSYSYNSRLATYNFGGIVGKGSYIAVSNCYSLMTSFNERLAEDENGLSEDENKKTSLISNTNAIVGANSSIVQFSGNKYNSSVCMAYQEESGNQDIAYGSVTDNYYGYTNIYDTQREGTPGEGTDNTGANSSNLYSNENILDGFQDKGIDFNNIVNGHKLSPYEWSQSNENNQIKVSDDDDEDYFVTIEGSLHNITWVAVTENVSTSRPIADNLKNYAIIGNGHIITRTDDNVYSSTNTDTNKALGYGALINNMGEGFDTSDSEKLKDQKPNFNVVAGLIMNLEISSADVNGETGKSYTAYGGVAGTMKGSSFIYGVGVKGELSVGGENSQLHLGGMAGLMLNGSISESYVDADITYRASEGGILSGIANMADQNTTIKSTYSSGLLETYVDVDIYTFANSGNNNASTTSADVMDCYSISQIKRNNALGSEFEHKSSFINEFNSESESTGLNVISNVISGSNEVLDNEYGTPYEMDSLSIPYYGYKTGEGETETTVNGISQNSLIIGNKDEKLQTLHTWYFNRYVNYGYASHGFGYLKNTTTYELIETTIGEDSNTVTTREYNPITYDEIISNGDTYGGENSNWYMGVLNQGKFDQMYDTVEYNVVDGANQNTNYDQDYKFVLRYSFVVSEVGKNLGDPNYNLVIDGQNVTLDLSGTSTSGLFGTFIGEVRNLRISNANIDKPNSEIFGILANVFEGNIDNVSVNGEITNESSTKYIGGIVGVLEGTASNVDAVVNISTSKNSIVGGVVGYLANGTVNGESVSGKIEYASNNGQIIQTVDSSTNILTKYDSNKNTVSGANIAASPYQYIQTDKLGDGKNTTSLNGIAGGIVGYAESGTTISSSYNTNAVLSQYTISDSKNVVAGGIVGYTAGATDSKVTLENNYNTGLVGAGNTSSTFSMAGGIVGYGEYTTVSSCVNDGPVQAIGKAETNDKNKYEITVKKDSGVEETTEYSNNPDPLVYNVTLTYNPNAVRQVFAFGVGYLMEGSDITDSASSTNNIKNDGNLGKIVLTEKLTFDRKTILDGNGDYEAIYSIDKGDDDKEDIYINAYDSYGYASRIYMQDQITRRYVGFGTFGDKSGYVNEIAYNEKQQDGYGNAETSYPYWGNKPNYSYYRGIYDLSNGKATESNMKINFSRADSDFNSIFNDDIYTMASSTTYYESVVFTRYDELLSVEDESFVNGVVGCSNGVVYRNSNEYLDGNDENINQSIKELAEDQIEQIQSNKENGSSMKYFTVNGENAAVVYNSANIKTVYAPFKYEASSILNISSNKIDYNNLSKNNFTIGNVLVNGVNVSPQFSIIDFERTDASGNADSEGDYVKINFELYFDREVSGNISYTMNYRIAEQSILLGKNNVTLSGGQIKVKLEDDSGQIGLLTSTIDEINNSATSGNYTVVAKVGDTNLSNLKLSYDDNGIYLTCRGNLNEFDNKLLSITITKEEKYEIDFTGSINLVERNAEFSIVNDDDTETARFVGYSESTINMASNAYTTIITTKDGLNYVTGIKISLAQVLNDYGSRSRFALGVENIFDVHYENSVLKINNDIVDGYKFEIAYEGDVPYLYVRKADISSGEEVVIDENSDSDLLKDYTTELGSFFESIANFKIYYDRINSEIWYRLRAHSDTESQNNIEFSYNSSAIDNGNFGADGYYHGSDFNNEPEGNGVRRITNTLLGMDFVIQEVTYTYKITNGTLKNLGEDAGYELTMSSQNVNKVVTQGYLRNNDTITLNEATISQIDKFSILMTETTKNIDASKGETGYLISNANGTKQLNSTISYTYNIKESALSTYDYTYNYVITSGTETCPICNQKETYYCTEGGNFQDTASAYSYKYKIYSCGTISVEYYLTNTSSIGQGDKWRNSRKFVTNLEKMLNNEMDVYTAINYDDNNGFTWKKTTETLVLDRFSSYTPNETIKPLGGSFKCIYVDLICAYFDENTLLFARNNLDSNGVEDNDPFDSIKFTGTTYIKAEDSYKINTYSKNEEFLNCTDAVNAGTFEYRVENENRWQKSDTTRIDASTYTPQYYYYRYRKSIEATVILPTASEKSEQSFEYIIMADDISLGVLTFKENTKVIIGNGYNITYISDGNNGTEISLFATNNKDIKNLNIIGIVSALSASSDNLSMLTLSNNANILNVSLFGNIRNINAESGNISVRSTISTNANNIATLKINSYVVMTGLDSESDSNVSTKLIDNVMVNNKAITNEKKETEENIPFEYNSSNILIAGNGGNGNDGLDGKNAGDTGNGGDSSGIGGSITIQSETFDGYYRLGINGVAGNGGNGENGNFDTASNKALGGGGGGKRGSTPTDSAELTKDGSDTIENGLKQNSKSDKSCGGNGGIGGFGRIINGTLYSSGGGGSSNGGGAGEDGSNNTGVTPSELRNYGIGYGFMYDSTFITQSDEYYRNIREGGAMETPASYREMQSELIESAISEIDFSTTNATLVGGAGGGSGDEIIAGGQVAVSKIYVSTQTDAYFYRFAGSWCTVNKVYKMAWTSGEIINSGGSFGYSGSPYN